ncbi:MAG: hypothetical protein M1821_003427 [Bathelium mastoideum]|nr:MAG: hypothetical protein M1821_003427 [Bathelium mastoideum]KAI9686015.1 MAG: hypothetical protein M1822_003998 [Bathelium mastoideum]
MLGRLVLSRLSTELPKTRPYDVAQLSQKLIRLSHALNAYTAPPSYLSQSKRLLHASVQSCAARSATTTRKPAKTGRTAAKKATPRRAPKKRATSRKRATPSKRTSGRKKTATKAKKKPAKRVLSEKSQARLAVKKRREKVKELQEVALLASEPKHANIHAWLMLTSEVTRGHGKVDGAQIKEASEKYKNLSPSEREHYNHLANERNAAVQSEYRRWIHSHTPERIRQANSARASLRRLLTTTSANPGHKELPKSQARKLRSIEDDRAVKPAEPVYIIFTKERHLSGDLKSVSIGDAGKLIASEWKALSPGEKAKYENIAKEDRARWEREYKDVYGHAPPVSTKKTRRNT